MPAVPGGNGGAVDAATQQDPNDVLKATNAREVAGLICSDADGDTCFDKASASLLKTISDNFNGSLLGSDGKTTSPLAKAVASLMGSSVTTAGGTTPIWDRQHVKYPLVHLVKYSKGTTEPVVHDKWIQATAGKNGIIELNDSLHIPGVRSIALVFIHLDAPLSGTTRDKAAVTAQYGNISYRAVIAKKLPVNLQNLIALLKLAAGSLEAESAAPAPVSFVGFGVMTNVDVPSDVTVFGVRLSDQSKLIGQSQKYDNEGKYWWDVSVAVPVNKITLLDYSSDNGGVFTPKTINKQSVYGVVNLYPVPVDLKYGNARWLMPRALLGIGLTGRPGENFMVGGAWGFPQLQFFVGSAFANHQVLPAGADPKSGASYTQGYASRLTFGINVPVLAAIKKLASAKDDKGSSVTAKPKN